MGSGALFVAFFFFFFIYIVFLKVYPALRYLILATNRGRVWDPLAVLAKNNRKGRSFVAKISRGHFVVGFHGSTFGIFPSSVLVSLVLMAVQNDSFD